MQIFNSISLGMPMQLKNNTTGKVRCDTLYLQLLNIIRTNISEFNHVCFKMLSLLISNVSSTDCINIMNTKCVLYFTSVQCYEILWIYNVDIICNVTESKEDRMPQLLDIASKILFRILTSK